MRLNLTYVVVIVAGIGLCVISSVKAAPVSNSSDAGDDCPTVIVKFHEHWGIDSSTPNAPRQVKDELQELVTTYATFLGLEKEQHPIIQLKNTFKVRPEVGYKRGDPYQADFRGMGECQQDGDCVVASVGGFLTVIKKYKVIFPKPLPRSSE